jgi:Flp pilus assembly pilin Flp
MLIDLQRNARRLVKDDRGVDLVEYGLIGAVIAIAGILMFPTIFAKLDAAFETWGQNVWNEWEPDNPASFVPPSP